MQTRALSCGSARRFGPAVGTKHYAALRRLMRMACEGVTCLKQLRAACPKANVPLDKAQRLVTAPWAQAPAVTHPG